MTWDEFKARVDAEIAAHGADGSVEVRYIDVSDPDPSHASTEPEVHVADGRVTVQN